MLTRYGSSGAGAHAKTTILFSKGPTRPIFSRSSGGVAYLFIMSFPLFSSLLSIFVCRVIVKIHRYYCDLQSRWLQLHLSSMTMPRLAEILLASLHIMTLQRQILLQQRR